MKNLLRDFIFRMELTILRKDKIPYRLSRWLVWSWKISKNIVHSKLVQISGIQFLLYLLIGDSKLNLHLSMQLLWHSWVFLVWLTKTRQQLFTSQSQEMIQILSILVSSIWVVTTYRSQSFNFLGHSIK